MVILPYSFVALGFEPACRDKLESGVLSPVASRQIFWVVTAWVCDYSVFVHRSTTR